VAKPDLYARHCGLEYWLGEPKAEAIMVLSDPQDGRCRAEPTRSDVAISATIPGLSADLKALFAPVPGL
jgi:hypothetical protein